MRLGATLLGLSLVLVPWVLRGATTYGATQSRGDDGLTQNGEFVVNAILVDMGLALPDTAKGDRIDNTPRPPNKDQNDKTQDDDDFFNDDRGFDDVKQSFDAEFTAAVAKWNKEYEDTVARWKQARTQYDKDKTRLASTAFDLRQFGSMPGAAAPATVSAPRLDLDAMKAGEHHVIPHALSIDVRNQVMRSTCAAFAGVRALEAVLWQHEAMRAVRIDLSEQYFYWISKPNCHTSPCGRQQDGSWSDAGYEQLLDPSSAALMLERDCPYNPYPNEGNVTETPLRNCSRESGLVRAGKFNSWLRLDQVVDELARNHPVVAAFKLNNSFLTNKGLVRMRDPANRQTASGAHVDGHAILLIGYVKLPQKFWADEGKYCALIDNSWGVGYGVGGHACVTEEWMKQNRFPYEGDPARSYLTSVESVVFVK